MNQTSIFDIMYPKYKITKPIRLIEIFSGYGSQALALKYLGVPFEHWRTCEWAIKSIQAYKDVHFTDDNFDYSQDITKEDIINILYQKGISSNYNEPMTLSQIKRLPENQLRTIYNNIVATRNMVNIQQVTGTDLQINLTNKYDYILTYSFPCQDLSLAGKGKGMSDTSTRSGMLWEVERILTECHKLGSMPQILLMENVPQVHSKDNMPDFHKWQVRLEELGYKSYWQDLIATDYGIPQTRNRCFMISILGDYSYTFPQSIPLKLKLKDMLENNVDEKYYLSDSMNKSLIHTLEQNKINDSCYIDTYNKKIDKEKSGTITTGVNFRNNTFLAIKNATKQGYLEATDGDGIDISSRMEYHRGNVQKDKIQTLTTSGGNDRGVVTLGNYSPSNHNASRIVDKEAVAPTVMENHGTITATQTSDLRIRKLTPRECGRLMNVKDEDIDKINLSDSAMYHIFGDSICTNVLMAIFGELLDIDWKRKLEEMLYDNK